MLRLVSAPNNRSARTPLVWLITAAAALLMLLPLTPGTAAADPSDSSASYWVVPGQPGTDSDLTLPDVAERVLGNSERWPEIFELNQGRTQPDGLVLTDPSQLRAGWALALPEGARSGEIKIGPPPGAPPAQVPADKPVPGNQPIVAGQPGPGGELRILGLTPLVAALLGGGVLVLVAGLIVVLLVRSRRTAPVPASTAASGSRAVLDRALRQLAAQTSQAQVYAAIVGPDRVSLRLAPALPEAPPPWQARQQGSVWEAPNWQLDAGVSAAGAGLPLLATVGTVGGELTVVNLGRAPGVVALTGDPTASVAVAGDFLREIGSDPAAAAVAITIVGPMPATGLAPGRFRIATDVREVTGELTGGPAVPGAPGGTPDAPRPLRGQLVVVTAPIPSAAMERLGAMATVSDNTAAVLVVGDVANAAWRFESGTDGSLGLDVLGLHLDAPETPRNNRLTPAYGNRG